MALGARRLFRDEGAALAAGLLFAVHPAHAESVAWVGGQADLLAAGFGLGAVMVYVEGKERGILDFRFWILDFLAYLMACLAKETGVAAILVVGILEATEWRREGSVAAALRRGMARLAPFGGAVGVTWR